MNEFDSFTYDNDDCQQFNAMKVADKCECQINFLTKKLKGWFVPFVGTNHYICDYDMAKFKGL